MPNDLRTGILGKEEAAAHQQRPDMLAYHGESRSRQNLLPDGPLRMVLHTYSAHRLVPVLEAVDQLGIDLCFLPTDFPDGLRPLDLRTFGGLKASSRRHLLISHRFTALEDFVFEDWSDFHAIDLPASLTNVHGSAFAKSKLSHISVDAGNRCLRVIGDFLIDIDQSRLIRYFGSSSAIILSQSVEAIGSYCFANCGTLMSISFESGWKLTRIERNAFVRCSLRSIVIPASVTTICGGAFAESGICQISIEEGNVHFSVIGQFLLDITRTSLIAFFGTAATVTISREIRILCDSCFIGRSTLSRLNFEGGSQLRRVERLAFVGCSSLHLICLPSSIESLEREWFLDSHFHGGVVFDTVRFESTESLSKMVYYDCADLSGDFIIEVLDWTDKTMIPGFCVDTVISDNLVRLKRSSDPSI
jgi:hypothetical protein